MAFANDPNNELVVTGADGSKVILLPQDGGQIQFVPNSVPNVSVLQNGTIHANVTTFGPSGHYTYLAIDTPQIQDSHGPSLFTQIELLSASTDGTPFPHFSVANSLLEIQPDVEVHGIGVFLSGLVDGNGIPYKQCVNGQATLTFASATSFTTAISFGQTFPSAPAVMTNIDNGAGATAQWHSRAINITTTGFTLFVFSTSASAWTNIPVSWQATAR